MPEGGVGQPLVLELGGERAEAEARRPEVAAHAGAAVAAAGTVRKLSKLGHGGLKQTP